MEALRASFELPHYIASHPQPKEMGLVISLTMAITIVSSVGNGQGKEGERYTGLLKLQDIWLSGNPNDEKRAAFAGIMDVAYAQLMHTACVLALGTATQGRPYSSLTPAIAVRYAGKRCIPIPQILKY